MRNALSNEMMEALKVQLICHEGLTCVPQINETGELTIGVGRKLYQTGISEIEAEQMLERDLAVLLTAMKQDLPIFHQLSETRKQVLLNMAFTINIDGLKKLKKLLAALCIEDFTLAANEILDSNWILGNKDRKAELSMLMKAG
ncbi:glycoside hydrolase [Pseudoalteromonas luteoviolacea]|uniref:glycoside hydrolase family protein n=1 Tax=Pseudoalteromonas luteoviolacea TaxID=43657 RepID=UPI001B37A4CD|nr:glycoside hydrolase [Pseudoalteromonas luteoviolacea]MBQ4812891.1 glycoside hydrolase [Pseudoalteromonas luteoviolacea]